MKTALSRFGALLILLAAIAGTSTDVFASSPSGPIRSAVPDARLVGEGQMTFLGFRIFNAELFAPGGVYQRSNPFALRLTYLRNFKGTAISDQTIKELSRLGAGTPSQRQNWREQMNRIFPNVSKGQNITGIRKNSRTTVFYSNGRRIGEISDPAFTGAFFDIWLGTNTKNPKLRARLVGAGS